MLANFDQHKIPFNLIASHFIAGAVALLSTLALLILNLNIFNEHHFQPVWLAAIHLIILGFAVSITYGVSVQILPVMSDTKKAYKSLSTTIFVLHFVGTLMLVINFYNFNLSTLALSAGTLITISGILYTIFVFSIFSESITSSSTDFIKTAALWFLITVIIGITLLLNLRFAFLSSNHLEYLPIHASIGFVGWFLQLFIGVAQKLFPMFLVSHVPTNTLNKLNKTYWLLNLSLIGLLISAFFNAKKYYIIIPCTISIAWGLIYFINFIKECFKNRLRKNIDSGMKISFIGIIFLALTLLASVTALILNIDLKKEIGLIFIFGFLIPLFMGQTFKTLPFLRWLDLKNKMGLKFKLQPNQLYNNKVLMLQNISYVIGILVFMFFLLTKITLSGYIALLLLLSASVFYIINVYKISFNTINYE